jgi:hypothetical protein
MDSKWYDDVNTIALNLGSLGELRALVDARSIAVLHNREKLHAFVVLDVLLLETNGGISKLTEPFSAFTDESKPKAVAITAEERKALQLEGGVIVPCEHSTCPICLRHWSIANWQYSKHSFRYRQESLGDYLDKPYGRVLRDFHLHEGGVCLEHSISKNFGEEETLLEILKPMKPENDYLIDPGDVLNYLHTTFFCADCREIYDLDEELRFYQQALSEAGLPECRMSVSYQELESGHRYRQIVARTVLGDKISLGWRYGLLEIDYSEARRTSEKTEEAIRERVSETIVRVANLGEAAEFLQLLFSN